MYSFKLQTKAYDGLTYSQAAKTIEITIDTDEATLDELLSTFEDFLRASGYVLDGNVVIDDPEHISDYDDILNSYPRSQGDTVTRGDQMEFNFGSTEEVKNV